MREKDILPKSFDKKLRVNTNIDFNTNIMTIWFSLSIWIDLSQHPKLNCTQSMHQQ